MRSVPLLRMSERLERRLARQHLWRRCGEGSNRGTTGFVGSAATAGRSPGRRWPKSTGANMRLRLEANQEPGDCLRYRAKKIRERAGADRKSTRLNSSHLG